MTPATTKTRPQWHCQRCGHIWHSHKDRPPERCAKCTSPAWDGYDPNHWRGKRAHAHELARVQQALSDTLSVAQCHNNDK